MFTLGAATILVGFKSQAAPFWLAAAFWDKCRHFGLRTISAIFMTLCGASGGENKLKIKKENKSSDGTLVFCAASSNLIYLARRKKHIFACRTALKLAKSQLGKEREGCGELEWKLLENCQWEQSRAEQSRCVWLEMKISIRHGTGSKYKVATCPILMAPLRGNPISASASSRTTFQLCTASHPASLAA